MKWSGTVLVALGIGGAAVFSQYGGYLGSAVYFPLCALGLVLMVRSVRVHRPAAASGWCCVAAAYALWFAADAVYVLDLHLSGVDPGPVSSATPLYLLAYLPLLTGLLLMTRHERSERRRAALLEGGIVSVALTLMGCLFFIGPALGAGGPLPPRLVGAAYLVGDIVAVALAVQLLATGRRSTSHLLGTAGLLVTLVADASWTVVGRDSPLLPVLAAGVLVSNALWGAAALHLQHQGTRAAAAPGPAPVAAALSARRLVVLALALALPSGLVAVLVQRSAPAAEHGLTGAVWAVAAAGLLMSVLVLARVTAATSAARTSLDARERMRGALEHQATHDPLTGLANRSHTRERLDAALREARGTDAVVAVLYVDLDGFKTVNDTLGHRAGDAVLRAAADRLTASARESDVVGRLGGDEFLVVLTEVDGEAAAAEVAQRLLAVLAAPVEVEGGVVDVGASIGVATTRSGALTGALTGSSTTGTRAGVRAAGADALLHEADTAAYRAKAAGRGCVVVFDEALRRELADRADLEDELRTAIATGQLELFYQPVVDLFAGAGGSGRDVPVVGGMEALVRWNHPARGLVGPDAFVPVAESSDLVCDLGRWVLRTAARQQAAWARLDPAGRGPLVGVNLAPRHLAQPTVVAEVAAAVAEAGVAPGRFLVEVTETELIDSQEALDNLRHLRALGVLVAIDDFGTGWTSIGQLQHLPCDVLKVDRGLVVSTAPGAAELLALVVRAGHAFGMHVVAEGVETPEQQAAAAASGADCAQGWLWCAAVPASAHDDLVAGGSEVAALVTAKALTA